MKHERMLQTVRHIPQRNRVSTGPDAERISPRHEKSLAESRYFRASECNDEDRTMTNEDHELKGAEAKRYADSRLRKVRVDPGNWTIEYEDPETGERWLMDYPDSGAQGGGSPRLRKLTASQTG
jgi:hypothetical protein